MPICEWYFGIIKNNNNTGMDRELSINDVEFKVVGFRAVKKSKSLLYILCLISDLKEEANWVKTWIDEIGKTKNRKKSIHYKEY